MSLAQQLITFIGQKAPELPVNTRPLLMSEKFKVPPSLIKKHFLSS